MINKLGQIMQPSWNVFICFILSAAFQPCTTANHQLDEHLCNFRGLIHHDSGDYAENREYICGVFVGCTTDQRPLTNDNVAAHTKFNIEKRSGTRHRQTNL